MANPEFRPNKLLVIRGFGSMFQGYAGGKLLEKKMQNKKGPNFHVKLCTVHKKDPWGYKLYPFDNILLWEVLNLWNVMFPVVFFWLAFERKIQPPPQKRWVHEKRQIPKRVFAKLLGLRGATYRTTIFEKKNRFEQWKKGSWFCWGLYRGCINPTQVYRDYFINHEIRIRIPMNQPV